MSTFTQKPICRVSRSVFISPVLLSCQSRLKISLLRRGIAFVLILGRHKLYLKTHHYTALQYIILLWCTLCEIYCLAYRKCQTEDFRCEVNGPGSGPCLPKLKRCDGYFDCRNHKDEENCGSAMNMSCPLDKFRCLNGQKCIDPKLKCDHQNNCGDNSDEENCSEYYICIDIWRWWTSFAFSYRFWFNRLFS